VEQYPRLPASGVPEQRVVQGIYEARVGMWQALLAAGLLMQGAAFRDVGLWCLRLAVELSRLPGICSIYIGSILNLLLLTAFIYFCLQQIF
jgi:hypothetical protein